MPGASQKLDAEARQLRELISEFHQARQDSARFRARSRELSAECARIYEAAMRRAKQLDSIRYSLFRLEERIRETALYGEAHPKDRERGGGRLTSLIGRG